MTKRTTTAEQASEHIGGAIADGYVTYYDDATCHWWRNPVEDLNDLATLLDDDDDAVADDAYSHWCARTSGQDLGTTEQARAAGYID